MALCSYYAGYGNLVESFETPTMRYVSMQITAQHLSSVHHGIIDLGASSVCGVDGPLNTSLIPLFRVTLAARYLSVRRLALSDLPTGRLLIAAGCHGDLLSHSMKTG